MPGDPGDIDAPRMPGEFSDSAGQRAAADCADGEAQRVLEDQEGTEARRVAGDWLEVCVRDTGIGIRAEDIPRMFSEFEQLDSGPGRHYEGTGLGLALTKRIVEFQSGHIDVESQPGKGSAFTVSLPL
jgi:signal transduction histidine kinase